MSEAASTLPMVIKGDAADISSRPVVSGWFGMWWLIASEGALFAYLLFSYYYSLLQVGGSWPPEGPPSLRLALPNTFVLLASSLAVWFAERGIRRNELGQLLGGLIAALVLGLLFVGVQLTEWSNTDVRPQHASLWLILFHHHRLSHGPCHRGPIGARDAGLVDVCWPIGSPAPRASVDRRPLLAFRRCRLARRIYNVLPRPFDAVTHGIQHSSPGNAESPCAGAASRERMVGGFRHCRGTRCLGPASRDEFFRLQRSLLSRLHLSGCARHFELAHGDAHRQRRGVVHRRVSGLDILQ